MLAMTAKKLAMSAKSYEPAVISINALTATAIYSIFVLDLWKEILTHLLLIGEVIRPQFRSFVENHGYIRVDLSITFKKVFDNSSFAVLYNAYNILLISFFNDR